MNKKKDKKLKVRVTFNENISGEEEQAIWNDVFDLLLKKKKPKQEDTPEGMKTKETRLN